MSFFRRCISIAPMFAALLLAACGGGDTAAPKQAAQMGQGIAVGEPNGGAPVASEFIKMAKAEACTDILNRMFVIDNKQVYWDRQGNCPDMSYARRLYGATPEALLCKTQDSIAGPQNFCANDTARALFETIERNRDKPDLGLAASGHKVEQLDIPPKTGSTAGFRTLVKESFSGVDKAQNLVVKDREAFDKLWGEHYSRHVQLPPLPVVDFSRQMVVAVFAGTEVSACGGLSIARAVAKDGKLVVEYEVAAPPADTVCVAVVTQPAHIVVVDRTDAPVEFVALKTTRLLSVSIGHTNRSGISTARNAVVKDQQAWEALWTEHAGKETALPAVDFNKQMVVAVFLGARPGGCYSTTIDGVTRDGKQINVRRTDTVPGIATLCTKDIVTPAHLVATERSDLPVVFANEEKQLEQN